MAKPKVTDHQNEIVKFMQRKEHSCGVVEMRKLEDWWATNIRGGVIAFEESLNCLIRAGVIRQLAGSFWLASRQHEQNLSGGRHTRTPKVRPKQTSMF